MTSNPASGPGKPTAVDLPLSEAEHAALVELHAVLYRALILGEGETLQAMRFYLQTKNRIARRHKSSGIVNNRVFCRDHLLVVPYIWHDTVFVLIGDLAEQRLVQQRFPPGTIFTDALLAELTGVRGEPIPLQKMLFVVEPETIGKPQLARLGDMAALLEHINRRTNRNESVYLLRHLIARLFGPPVPVTAKNLQPEVAALTRELVTMLNGPLRRRLPWFMRLLVRNLSGVIGRPNVIDGLWSDTIALAEVHVRGSAIVNEIRRTSHHALGLRTLQLARAYRAYLRDGDDDPLFDMGFVPGKADEQARGVEQPRVLIERVVNDLERLLASAAPLARIRDWQQTYSDALLRCATGHSLDETLEQAIAQGLRARNRWSYYQHLRTLRQKIAEFGGAAARETLARLDPLEGLRPDEPGFDPATATRDLQDLVQSFRQWALQRHQQRLYEPLAAVLSLYEKRDYGGTVDATRALRRRLARMIDAGAFELQRFLLIRLDCLLEELAYLAARHVASSFEREGEDEQWVVDLDKCFHLIRVSALNLEFDGLFSRDLLDFSALVEDATERDAELFNALRQIERCYQRVRQRVTVPYEKIRERLGFSHEELRLTLANMQRCMHDLNTMAHFADIAGAQVQMKLTRKDADAPPREPRRRADQPVIHLSDREEIARLVGGEGGTANLRMHYGGKGTGLMYISHLGIPTRDGFVLPTTLPRQGLHLADDGTLERTIAEHLRQLERDVAHHSGLPKRLGDTDQPLLVAVRGGSVMSMPGILSTIVFVGINDAVAETLARDDPWQAYDAYRRFLSSFAASVWGEDLDGLRLIDEVKARYRVPYKTDLPPEVMLEIAERYKELLAERGYGEQLQRLLAQPELQVYAAVRAVFASWNSDTARHYREIKGLSHSWHTAAVVQEMAFGNRLSPEAEPGMDETQASLTGVVTRTHANDFGVRQLDGEFKFSAAGDDLVGGVVGLGSMRPITQLRELMPMLMLRLRHVVAKLRRWMGTDQEIEFTVDRGVLSVLQCRTAETRIAEAMVDFVDPGEPTTRGLGICGGAFRGMVAFDEDDLKELASRGRAERDDIDGLLLLLQNPTPEDIPWIISAGGLLTAKGGSTSHAAVAANGIEDRPYAAVMSAIHLRVDADNHQAVIGDAAGEVRHSIGKGDVISIHGTTGEVFIGSRPITDPKRK